MAVEDTTGQPPPPEQNHAARNAAVAALGLTLLPTPGAGLAVTAQAQMQTALLTALVRFQTRRQRAFIDELRSEVLHQDPQLADVIDELIGRELNYEASFRRKQYDRVQAELPVALAIGDPTEREQAIRKLFEQERRFTQLREQAMRERVISAVHTWHVRQSSPNAAVWKLGARKTHCPECLALAGPTGARVLPWSIIDQFPPPRHVNCGCAVYTVAHALQQGWVSSGKLTEADVEDAIDTLRLAADALREGLTEVNVVSADGYTGEDDESRQGNARQGRAGHGSRGVDVESRDGAVRRGVRVEEELGLDGWSERGVHGVDGQGLDGEPGRGTARQSRQGCARRGKASQGVAVKASLGTARVGSEGEAGEPWRGEAAQGMEGVHGEARRDEQGHGMAGADKARTGDRGEAGHGLARVASQGVRGQAGQGVARQGSARHGSQGVAGAGSARRGKAGQARPGKARDGTAGQDKAVKARTAGQRGDGLGTASDGVHGMARMGLARPPGLGEDVKAWGGTAAAARRAKSWRDELGQGTAGQARPGPARDGKDGAALGARNGKSRNGMAVPARLGRAGQGSASQDKAVEARRGMEGVGKARSGKAVEARHERNGKAGHGEAVLARGARLGAAGVGKDGQSGHGGPVGAARGEAGTARQGSAVRAGHGEVGGTGHGSPGVDGSARIGVARHDTAARSLQGMDGPARHDTAGKAELGLAGHGGAGLDEAEWTERFPKGFAFGGRFRPRVGGDPGAALLKKLGLHRRSQRTPEPKPGAWVRLAGRQVRVPRNEAWARRLGGDVYHSPAGTTDVYRNTMLLPTTHVPHEQTDRAHDLADAIKQERAKRAFRRGGQPLRPGDSAGDVLSMQDRGYDLVQMRPAGKRKWRLGFHHPGTGATATATVTDRIVGAAHHDTAPLLKQKARVSDGTPRSWGEFQQDALAWAHQLAVQHHAPLRFRGLTEEPQFEDHVGMHDFDGTTYVGRDVRPDIERAAKTRAQQRKLTEGAKRGQYSSYWTVAHEIAHSVNPMSPGDYHGENANLEEALAEEMSHVLARQRLHAQHQDDVINWANANPSSLPVLGVYRKERGALGEVLDIAGISSDKRAALVEQLAFRTRPAERFHTLGNLIHKQYPNIKQADAEQIAREHLRHGGPPRSVLTPLTPGFMDKLADIVGVPKSDIVAQGGTFADWENKPIDMGGVNDEPALHVTGRGPIGTHLQTAKDENGDRWLVQQHSHDQDHVASELLANRVYREVGLRAPDYLEVTTPGGPAFEKRTDDLKKEPELPESYRLSTGILLVEKDGRVVLIKPRGGYGGYKHSFPKGGMESGLSAQQNAHKELFEETGLHAHIIGTLGDYRGDTGETRYYVGVRTGGEPTPSSETEAVETVRPKQAMEMLNRERDRDVLADLKKSPLFKKAKEKAGAFTDKFPPVVPGKAIAFRPVGGKTVKADKLDKEQLAAGYMADALLGNWDVTGGTWGDNLLWDKEHPDPVRVNHGATFEYASSGRKEYGPAPTEVWSMLRRGLAPKDFSDDELRAQAAQVSKALPDERIDELIDSAPFKDTAMRERVRDALKQRTDWMRRFASGEEDLPEPASGDEARGLLADALSNFQLYPEEQEALDAYQGKAGRELDEVARDGKTEPSKAQENFARHLDNVLTDARVPADVYAYAGLGQEPGASFAGQTVKQKSYTRLSTDLGALRDAKASVRVLVPGDSHGLFLEDADGADDLLLPRQARLKILRVGEDENGKPMADALLLPYQKPSSLYVKPYSYHGGGGYGSKPKGVPPKWVPGERVHLDGTSINATVTRVEDLGDGLTRVWVEHDGKENEQLVTYRDGWVRYEDPKAQPPTGKAAGLTADGAKHFFQLGARVTNRHTDELGYVVGTDPLEVLYDGDKVTDQPPLGEVVLAPGDPKAQPEAWGKPTLYYDAKTGKTTETPPFLPGADKVAGTLAKGDRVQHKHRGWLGTVSKVKPFRVKWDGQDRDAAMTRDYVTKVGGELAEWTVAQRERSLEVRRMGRHELGVTPFRPEDEPGGFYDSDKFKQFQQDVSDAAARQGLSAARVERASGVWQGGGEPSARVLVRGDDEKVRGMMDMLGGKYDQDGVLHFRPDEKGPHVRLVSKDKVDPAKVAASGALDRLPGATVREDGKLVIVATTPEHIAAAHDLANDVGAHVYTRRGYGELREAGHDYERWSDHGGSWRDGPGFARDGAGRAGEPDAEGSSRQDGRARADSRVAEEAGLAAFEQQFDPAEHPRGHAGEFVRGAERPFQAHGANSYFLGDVPIEIGDANLHDDSAVKPSALTQYGEAIRAETQRHPELLEGVRKLRGIYFGTGGAPPGIEPDVWNGVRAGQDDANAMATTTSSAFHPSQRILLNDKFDWERMLAHPPPNMDPTLLTAASRTSYGTITHELGHAWATRHLGRDRSGDAMRGLFREHGISPGDLNDVSPYAAADPTEAFAEMYAMTFTPGFELPPHVKTKFDALLADVAGRDAEERDPMQELADILRSGR